MCPTGIAWENYYSSLNLFSGKKIGPISEQTSELKRALVHMGRQKGGRLEITDQLMKG